METNPHLKAMILQVVNNQLRINKPPETRLTLKRLKREGYSEEKAREMIARAVTTEIYDILQQRKKYDNVRYVRALNKLPQMPSNEESSG